VNQPESDRMARELNELVSRAAGIAEELYRRSVATRRSAMDSLLRLRWVRRVLTNVAAEAGDSLVRLRARDVSECLAAAQ